MAIGDWCSIAATLVVIIIFLCERWIDRNVHKKETAKQWYIDVLVLPHIQDIMLFFDHTEHLFRNAVIELKEAYDTQTGSNCIKLLASKNGEFQEMKRKFELSIVAPILFNYKATGDKITSLLLNLEDSYTEKLDGVATMTNSTKDYISDSIRSIISYKGKLLAVLYNPIS